MTTASRPSTLAAAGAAVLLIAALPTDASALTAVIARINDIDIRDRLLLAAFGGLSIGIALGMFAFELRSRSLAVAVRRLTDLVVGMDGRFAESRRESAAAELARLSDELMFAAQRAARERREAEQRMGSWEALFAAALDGMFALDTQGQITFINPAAERLFKVKAEECVGRRLSDVMLPPSHRSPDNAAFTNDLATGKAQGRTQELVAQRSDGRQFPVEVSIAEFGAGEQRGFVVIARDISPVRRGRAELKRTRSQAASTEAELRSEIDALKRARDRLLASGHAAAAPVSPAAPAAFDAMARPGPAPSALAQGPSFTVEDVCGDAIRKLAARAERRGLGFRYEDNELHGTPLLGDTARLRRVLVGLVDSVVKAADRGEIVVHLQTTAGEGREIELSAQVTSTGMTDAQAARMVKPFMTETPPRREGSREADPLPYFDLLGTRVTQNVTPGAGATFRFQLRFAADLSHVAIDLSALPAPRAPELSVKAAPASDHARLHQEFAKSAARLRKHAEKPTLIALWAEAHRLKDLWQRYGGRDDIGLVTALAHTARGGDATNAVVLARRLADALDETARVSAPNSLRA